MQEMTEVKSRKGPVKPPLEKVHALGKTKEQSIILPVVAGKPVSAFGRRHNLAARPLMHFFGVIGYEALK